jgi:hypothetical protein
MGYIPHGYSKANAFLKDTNDQGREYELRGDYVGIGDGYTKNAEIGSNKTVDSSF